jgi:hypothetical protein
MFICCVRVQVLLHDPSETPLIQDFGFAISPGVHALVAVNKQQVTQDCHLYCSFTIETTYQTITEIIAWATLDHVQTSVYISLAAVRRLEAFYCL